MKKRNPRLLTFDGLLQFFKKNGEPVNLKNLKQFRLYLTIEHLNESGEQYGYRDDQFIEGIVDKVYKNIINVCLDSATKDRMVIIDTANYNIHPKLYEFRFRGVPIPREESLLIELGPSAQEVEVDEGEVE